MCSLVIKKAVAHYVLYGFLVDTEGVKTMDVEITCTNSIYSSA